MTKADLYKMILNHIRDTENNNHDLVNYINHHKDNWNGPILIEADKIKRTVGPEPFMLHVESETSFQKAVNEIAQTINNQNVLPYLICELYDGTYYLLDGNHTFEALKKLGHQTLSVIYTEDSIVHKLMNS